jgi:hypothetical protein
MAKLKVHRDTLGRCEPSSMLWDAVRNPHAPPVRREPLVVSSSGGQSEQTRINREIYDRLAQVKSPLFQLLSFLFSQACFIVGLPLYFVLCLVPQWCGTYLFSPVWKFIALHLGRLNEWLKRWGRRLSQGVYRVYIGLIGSRLMAFCRGCWAVVGSLAHVCRQAVLRVRAVLLQSYEKLIFCKRALLIGVCYLIAVFFALARLLGFFLSHNIDATMKRYAALR